MKFGLALFHLFLLSLLTSTSQALCVKREFHFLGWSKDTRSFLIELSERGPEGGSARSLVLLSGQAPHVHEIKLKDAIRGGRGNTESDADCEKRWQQFTTEKLGPLGFELNYRPCLDNPKTRTILGPGQFLASDRHSSLFHNIKAAAENRASVLGREGQAATLTLIEKMNSSCQADLTLLLRRGEESQIIGNWSALRQIAKPSEPPPGECQTDKDCHLIFDSCTCKSVPVNGAQQTLATKGSPRLCKCNECNCRPEQSVQPRCINHQCRRSDQPLGR